MEQRIFSLSKKEQLKIGVQNSCEVNRLPVGTKSTVNYYYMIKNFSCKIQILYAHQGNHHVKTVRILIITLQMV